MRITVPGQVFVIKDTHRGLWYEDGKLVRVLEAGRYKIPKAKLFGTNQTVECELVDIRERELTIKGQEILTADKVAIRVSILVQFRVTDPKTAVHGVENYVDRLYSDVQLAARRSLAAMMLEDILTNRNRLSEDILADVRELSSMYGVTMRRADVKDLMFPGNLQEIMNRVLAAERNAQAQLVEARTRAEVETIAAQSRLTIKELEINAEAEAARMRQHLETEAAKTQAQLQLQLVESRQAMAQLLEKHPALSRLTELDTLRSLATNANAQLFFNMDRLGWACDGKKGQGSSA